MSPPPAWSDDVLLKHGAFVRGLCASLLRDRGLSEEAAQEVLLRAWRARPDARGMRSWLRTVARNLASNLQRAERRRLVREAAPPPPEASPSAVEEASRRESLRSVVDAVTTLREPYRTAILMHYYEGLSPREIAGRLAVPTDTVKSRILRGRERIRRRLESGGPRTYGPLLSGPIAMSKATAPSLYGAFFLGTKLKITAAVVALALSAGVLWQSGFVMWPSETSTTTRSEARAGAPSDGEPAPSEPTRREVALAVESPESEVEASPGARAAKSSVGVLGRVIDLSGAPLAAATVTLVSRTEASGSTSLTATTGSDGRFVLVGATGGRATLTVRRAGYVPISSAPLVVSETEVHELRDLVLTRASERRGRVVDDGGRGIAGATVFTLDPKRRDDDLDAITIERTTTDGAGEFVLDESASGPQTVAALARGFVPWVERQPAAIAGSPLEIVLQRGWSIEGVLEGAPAVTANLRVRAVPAAESALSESLPSWVLYEESPGRFTDGPRFVVDGLAPGHAFYVSVSEVDASGRSAICTDVRPVDEAVAEIKLRYHARTALELLVTDAVTGDPLADFRVLGWDDVHEKAVRLDADSGVTRTERPDGAIRFTGLAATAPFRLAVGAAGYRTETLGPVTPGLGAPRLRVALEPTASVDVRVIAQATGLPVAGARVRFSSADPPLPARTQDGLGSSFAAQLRVDTTDGQGRVTLSAEEGAVTLVVEHDDFARHEEIVAIAAGSEWSVALVRAATVIVRTLDRNHRPVPGVDVEHLPPLDPPGLSNPPDLAAPSHPVVLTTDLEGKAIFTPLSAGKARFRARPNRGIVREMMMGGQRATIMIMMDDDDEQAPLAVDLETGETRELVLTVPRRVAVSGRVTQGGSPLAGADLLLVPGSVSPPDFAVFGATEGPTTTSARDGTFRLTGVDEGTHTLVVRHADRALPSLLEQDLDEEENVLHVDLPVVAIQGRVTDARGEPIANARVSVTPTFSGGQLSTRPHVMTIDESGTLSMDTGGPIGARESTAEDGTYRLTGLPVGVTLRLMFEARFGRSESRLLTLAAGEVRTVDIRLEEAGVVDVRLQTPAGSAGRNCQLSLEYLGGDAEVESVDEFVGGQGGAVFEGLRPGPWRLEVEPIGRTGDPSAPQEIMVTAGAVETTVVAVDEM